MHKNLSFVLFLGCASVGVASGQGPLRTVPTAAPVATSTTGMPSRAPTEVVFDQPRADGTLWALGQTWKGQFDSRGFTFLPFFGAEAPRNFPLRVELEQATVGGEPLSLRGGTPARRDQQVRNDRGPLVEVFDTSLLTVEQSFVFEQLPNRGAVAVAVRLAGEFTAAVGADGLQFASAHGSIGYTKALARDAAGRELPLTIGWNGVSAHIEIPASFVAEAKLPLVLDPVLQTASLASGFPTGREQRYPDVAKVAATNTTAVVWTRTWSATDEDVAIQRVNPFLTPFGPELYVDFSAENWTGPRIAGAEFSGNFLVVAQVDFGGASFISGRLLDQNGLLGSVFDIERGGVVGVPGNNFRPDVCGDAELSSASCFAVVFEHEAAAFNNDIYLKYVNTDGTLPSSLPSALENSAAMAQNPSISSSFTSFGYAAVAWQQNSQLPPFDEHIWGAVVSRSSGIFTPAFQVAASGRPERRPYASSFANLIGQNCFAIAFQDDFGTDNDIVVQLVDPFGTAIAPALSLNGAEAGGTFLLRNQLFPSIDTDGNRFAVGYSEFSGTDYDTYVTTATWLPVQGTWRLDDERAPLGANVGTDDYWTRTVPDWAFGSTQPSAEYTIVGANIATNEIEVRKYGGYRPGSYAVFGSQCGNLPIQVSGTPASGTYISFSLTTASPLAGYVFGFPGLLPIGICPCVLAVANGVTVPGANYTWYVPADPIFVNAFTLSVQGWAFGGSACLGAIDLSDTIDFTIR